MDRDGFLKVGAQFSTVCDASTINNQIIFFDINDIHFDDYALSYM